MDTYVIKLGTSTLTQGTKRLIRKGMVEIGRQVNILHEKGIRVVLVSSGAKAAGREILNVIEPATLPTKQMLTAVGQVHLMHTWTEIFRLFDLNVAQVLLTRSDFANRKRYLNIRDTLTTLLSHRVIPIINENDPVAIGDTKVGDNDNLSALAANMIAANLLILLTDQKGLYSHDPRKYPDAKLIPIVEELDDTILNCAKDTSHELGTGGMITKLEAARLATQSGTPTVIASHSEENVLINLSLGNDRDLF